LTATERSVDVSLLTNLRPHLDGLKRTTHGNILYGQIQRGLKESLLKSGRIDLVFVTFLYALLGKYAKDPACDPMTRVRARLVQQRLMIYLPEGTILSAIRPGAPPAIAEPSSVTRPETPTEKTEPASKKITAAASLAGSAPAPTPEVKSTPAPPSDETTSKPLESGAEKTEIPEPVVPDGVPADVVVGEKFGKLLESERTALLNSESPLAEFSDLKKILVKGLDELIQEREALIQKLSKASDYVQAVESERERLRVELTQARKHGLTDELTGLPKRDFFVRQLEAEIGRVRRYGFSLALALVDIDGLGVINERYGRAAGDAVLRCYSNEILAKFRTYDLVARYNGDEFAVLFPNTQKDGAMRALEKARKAAAETYIHQDGENIPLPSFSSVLTQYSPGEPPAALLKRADETLTQAKQTGSNRLIVALPTS
jgi:diguanylate cyclase (GGDEF)-like protein